MILPAQMLAPPPHDQFVLAGTLVKRLDSFRSGFISTFLTTFFFPTFISEFLATSFLVARVVADACTTAFARRKRCSCASSSKWRCDATHRCGFATRAFATGVVAHLGSRDEATAGRRGVARAVAATSTAASESFIFAFARAQWQSERADSTLADARLLDLVVRDAEQKHRQQRNTFSVAIIMHHA